MARERNDDEGGDFRRQDRDSHRERGDPRRQFERAVRWLKKDFQRNVLPAVKRNRFHVSKGEMKRIKQRKAARRRRRQLQRVDDR